MIFVYRSSETGTLSFGAFYYTPERIFCKYPFFTIFIKYPFFNFIFISSSLSFPHVRHKILSRAATNVNLEITCLIMPGSVRPVQNAYIFKSYICAVLLVHECYFTDLGIAQHCIRNICRITSFPLSERA